ncbi:MAG: hypothetical protein ACM3ZE_12210, partial [Myxococcales bacterium]
FTLTLYPPSESGVLRHHQSGNSLKSPTSRLSWEWLVVKVRKRRAAARRAGAGNLVMRLL